MTRPTPRSARRLLVRLAVLAGGLVAGLTLVALPASAAHAAHPAVTQAGTTVTPDGQGWE